MTRSTASAIHRRILDVIQMMQLSPLIKFRYADFAKILGKFFYRIILNDSCPSVHKWEKTGDWRVCSGVM